MGDKLAGALAACNKAHYLTQLNIVPHNKLKWN